jgi:hypothetical protein
MSLCGNRGKRLWVWCRLRNLPVTGKLEYPSSSFISKMRAIVVVGGIQMGSVMNPCLNFYKGGWVRTVSRETEFVVACRFCGPRNSPPSTHNSRRNSLASPRLTSHGGASCRLSTMPSFTRHGAPRGRGRESGMAVLRLKKADYLDGSHMLCLLCRETI